MLLTRRSALQSLGLAALAPAIPAASAQDKPEASARALEARTGSLALAEAGPTQILAYDGQCPGPLLRLKQGEELRLRLRNALAAPSSLHIRGMRGPNAFDGVAPLTQRPVAPNETFDIRFTPPDAGVYLYHAHAEGTFAEQTQRGLHGLLIVDPAEQPEHAHEVVAVLSDWALDPKGQTPFCDPVRFYRAEEAAGSGRLGPLIAVNGKPAPLEQSFQPGARVRLRLASATGARLMALTFEGAQPLVTAIDGQTCDAFEPVRRSIPVGPGARFDVMFDMPREGESFRVILRGGALGLHGETDRAILSFAAKGEARPARAPIDAGKLNPLLRPTIPLQNAKRLDLAIERKPALPGCLAPGAAFWTLNGRSGKPGDPPLFSVKQGSPVTLGFLNRTDAATVIRLHGHVMRQLHLQDDGWEPYWRDSVIVAPNRTVRIAFMADNPGRWRIGSGILAQAAAGLNGWFEVA